MGADFLGAEPTSDNRGPRAFVGIWTAVLWISTVRLTAGHLLGSLEPSVVLQVNRDARCPPGVTSDGGEKARRLARFRIAAQALYRSKNASRYLRSKRIKALKQGLPTLEACGDNMLVQFLLKLVMHRHLVLLAGQLLLS